jgi:hypothetical protein
VPQFLNRWLEWFRSKPNDRKFLIVLLALLVAIVASSLLKWVTAVAIVVVIVVVIARLARRSPAGNWALALVGLIAAFVLLGDVASAVYGPNGEGNQEAQQEETTQPEPGGTEEPTAVVSEVSDPKPVESEPVPEPPTKRAGPGHEWVHEWIPTTIPSLYPVDVYGNLKDRGFGCEGPAQVGGESVWHCTSSDTRAKYTVEILGPDASSVRLVEATVLSFDPSTTNETASDFLGYVATVPYEGSNPEQAKLWVQDNVDTTRPLSTKIGGVQYVLSGSGDARILEIHPPGSSG